MLPHLPIILLIVTRISSFALNRTIAASDSRAPAPVLFDRLPNPYHVPSSRIALEFLDHSAGFTFPRREMTTLLDKARDDIIARLARTGDMRISPGTHLIRSEGHVFVYESKFWDRTMMYSEVLTVIRGFGAKGRADQCKYRIAMVQYKAADG